MRVGASFKRGVLVIVNFMFQPACVMRCQVIWPNIILGVLVRVFLDELRFESIK